jgi:SAM-dependent methyltransferase
MTDAHGLEDVSKYYDFLYFWSQLTTRFSAFSVASAHTIHRPLVDRRTGEFSPFTIHRMIEPIALGLGQIDALDAGCGYGGSCLDLHQRLGGRWHGITINRKQHRIATRTAKVLGRTPCVTFDVASYDEFSSSRSFNLIYAVESLIHSADPHRTLSNLAGSLRRGGVLIIVDDMQVEPFPQRLKADLASFKAMWRCPVVPSVGQWSDYLQAAGCRVEATEDLTPLMGVRSEAEVRSELLEVQRRRRWRDPLGLRLVGDAQIGGLLLERLSRERAVLYTMIVARKL